MGKESLHNAQVLYLSRIHKDVDTLHKSYSTHKQGDQAENQDHRFYAIRGECHEDHISKVVEINEI